MKKPFVVLVSLICIYMISFLFYLGFNIGLAMLIEKPISLIGFIAATHILAMMWCFVVMSNKARRIETRIRWTVYICTIPFFGIVSYLLFGRPYKYKKNELYAFKSEKSKNLNKIKKTLSTIKNLEKDSPEFKRAFLASFKLQNEQIYNDFTIEVFSNGNEYFAQLLNDLKDAKQYILINMYIIHEGELLDQVSNILLKKIQEGVKVYIIYDFLGCYNQFRKTKSKFKKAGIEMLGYSPVHFPFIRWNANYRNHRKNIVIDGLIGYVGGINIGDEYCNTGSEFGFWNDSAYKITSSPVEQLEIIFRHDWNFYKKKKTQSLKLKNSVHVQSKKTNEFIQVISSGPNHTSPIHLDVLLSLINSAQKNIWIKSPYFIPPPELIDALCQASNSGLDVRLIIPGISDKPMLLDVSKNRTKKLFDNGVKIYSMYKTFVHEKSYIFDDKISFVGSTNLDYRALFSDQQTMLLIKSELLNKKVKTKFLNDFELSYLYTEPPTKQAKLLRRVVVKIYNVIAPIL